MKTNTGLKVKVINDLFEKSPLYHKVGEIVVRTRKKIKEIIKIVQFGTDYIPIYEKEEYIVDDDGFVCVKFDDGTVGLFSPIDLQLVEIEEWKKIIENG